MTKLAFKLGYGERQSECLGYITRLDLDFANIRFKFNIKLNVLWVVDGDGNRNKIFKDGIWAKFIPTEIEQLMEEIKKLKEKVSKLKG